MAYALAFLLLSLTLSPSLGEDNLVDIYNEGKKETLPLTEAVEFLQASYIKHLEETIAKLKEENQKLEDDYQEEMKTIEKEHEAAVLEIQDKIKKQKEINQNKKIQIDFMKGYINGDNQELKSCMQTFDENAKQLSKLARERKEYQMNNEKDFQKGYEQMNTIIEQEKEKAELKAQLKAQIEASNSIDFKLGAEVEAMPAYAKFLIITLEEQAAQIKKMSEEQLGNEQKVDETMKLIQEELEGLNFTFTSDIAQLEKIDKYQDIIQTQAKNLEDLQPVIMAVIESDGSEYEYQFNDDGELLEIAPCQCIPKHNEPGVTVSSLTFMCPAPLVSSTSLQETLVVPCPGGVCPPAIEDAGECGDFKELPWSDVEKCPGNPHDCILVDEYRERKVRSAAGIVSTEVELSGNSHNPLFWSNANTALSTGVADFSQQIWIPGGMKLGIFVVGGGGGADDSYSGSSGFFKYEEVTVESSGFYNISVVLGYGGDYSDGGDTTFDIVGVTGVTAKGGGKARGNGWSGGSSEKGGENGGNGESESNGSGETLPTVCSSLVTLEAGKTGDYDSDGTGGGGVIINGAMPKKVFRRDGEGFGAGGGEDNYDGYEGVAVLMVC